MSTPIDKFYVSDIDKKLAEFDRTHAPSKAQMAEIKKYETISQLRDHRQSQTKVTQSILWEAF